MADERRVKAAFRLPDGSAAIFLRAPIAATCCDNRMVSVMISRSGQTLCVQCDDKKSIRCEACGLPITPGKALKNSKATVCGWPCAAKFNATKKTNYAWRVSR